MLRTLCPTAAILCLVTGIASAGTIQLNPVVAAVYDLDFNPLPLPPIGEDAYDQYFRRAVYEVDVRMSVSNLLPNEAGFGNLEIDISLGPGLTEVGGGWLPNLSDVDSNGSLPGGTVPTFQTNADAGPPPLDLKSIRIAIPAGITNPVDPRRTLGQGQPISLGKLWVEWNGQTWTELQIDHISSQFNSTTGVFLPTGVHGPNAEQIFNTSEPAAFSMAAISLLATVPLARRGRARFSR